MIVLGGLGLVALGFLVRAMRNITHPTGTVDESIQFVRSDR